MDGATRASAEDSSTTASAAAGSVADRLAKLGFHVFTDPVALPQFNAGALESGAAPLDSSALSGSVTLLNFWATWCPPCKREMPSIDRLRALMKGSAFRIAAVSVGEKPDTVRAFIAKSGYAFPVYLDQDGKLGEAYASQGIPTTYLLDKAGRVVAGIVGSREYDEPELVAILREMAAQ